MLKIKLTQGKYALVDNADYEFIDSFKWLFSGGYAKRGIRVNGKNTFILMHRLINKTPDDLHTDHINGNTLDNRKKNLRTVTARQNIFGRRPSKNRTSIFKGVHLKKSTGRWYASIFARGDRFFLGGHSNEIEAAKAYDEKAKELFGDYAYLNFGGPKPQMENK